MPVLNDIQLENFNYSRLNPASIDLSISPFLREPNRFWYFPEPIKNLIWRYYKKPDPWDKQNEQIFWKEPIELSKYEDQDNWYWLKSGRLVLLSTNEYVKMPLDMAGLLVTTSSTGRVVLTHTHSSWVDPGFSGHLTLEYFSVSPWYIPLWRDQILIQLVVLSLTAAAEVGYNETGRYNNQEIIPQTIRDRK